MDTATLKEKLIAVLGQIQHTITAEGAHLHLVAAFLAQHTAGSHPGRLGDEYIIDRRPDGSALTKTTQIRLCGNSVCPDLAEALVRANCPDLIAERIAA